ncbi:hypothetical protein HBI81_131640 [Parastagonospora nodorum]|nr:hypothetical protein HBH53_102880 [Parastagonospora nodorum]KAH3997090.1 hypothetical protein HBI10_148720 [Parastagonospora nodorum]KAH4020076.1 hypothetical protein HBI13_121850 [Parastagonospora nodorum]KAH4197557.1 hypothetical protein HBH42_058850 [Parastagonospora nodorum]KAH4807619.1 hypothetical protein HBH61_129070 [Parastagonospora nodorum]
MSSKGLSNDEAAAITLRNQKDSPLLRLPAELRNHIYGYVFDCIIIHIRYDRGGQWPVYEQGSWDSLPFNADALVNSTAACRQVRAEAGHLFYENSELYFINWSVMVKILSGIKPRQRMMIKTIRLETPAWPLYKNIRPLKHLGGLERVNFAFPFRRLQLRNALRKLSGKAELQVVFIPENGIRQTT